jgi:uncharacterized membrane protein (DUF106 family)
MVFERLLDPVFNPLLSLGPFWALFIISFVISLVIVVIYKYTTDQNLMKTLKDEMKEFQKEIKELRESPEEAMKVQKKAMQTNMKYMMQSFKSTLYTFVPIIILFGWLNANLTHMPIMPEDQFSVTALFDKGIIGEAELLYPEALTLQSDAIKEIESGKIDWTLYGPAGEYTLGVKHNERSYVKNLLIDDMQYEKVEQKYKGDVKLIRINNEPLKVINLFGWKLGWLMSYIIFSIVFSIVLRKVFRVY